MDWSVFWTAASAIGSILVRFSWGPLRRITEKDGFIPARKKLSGDVFAYEYGLSKVVKS